MLTSHIDSERAIDKWRSVPNVHPSEMVVGDL